MKYVLVSCQLLWLYIHHIMLTVMKMEQKVPQGKLNTLSSNKWSRPVHEIAWCTKIKSKIWTTAISSNSLVPGVPRKPVYTKQGSNTEFIGIKCTCALCTPTILMSSMFLQTNWLSKVSQTSRISYHTK